MQSATEEIGDDAVPLCPGCFHVLENDPDFCPGCNAPVGMIALVDPLREARAYAYLYRRTAEFPNTSLVFRGGILLFSAYIAMAIGMTSMIFYGLNGTSSIAEWIAFSSLVLIYGSFGAVGLYKIFRSRHATPAELSTDDPTP